MSPLYYDGIAILRWDGLKIAWSVLLHPEDTLQGSGPHLPGFAGWWPLCCLMRARISLEEPKETKLAQNNQYGAELTRSKPTGSNTLDQGQKL